LKTLIPIVHGQTGKKDNNSGSKKQWDEESFFKELKSRRNVEEAEIARKILDWARDKLPRILWGNGKIDGSILLDLNGERYCPIAIWTYGKIEIQFQWLMNKSPFNDEMKRKELLNRLNQIPGVEIPEKAITRRPNIFLSKFKEDSSLTKLLETLDWVVQEMKSS